MWGKKLFNNKEKAPHIGVEIMGAKVTYSRCEFDTCQISFSTDGYDKCSTKLASSTLVGDTSYFVFRENAEFPIDSKITFHVKCTLNGIDNVLWSGKASVLPMDLIDEVKDFDILASPLDADSSDDIFSNITEAVASVSLRIFIPPIEPPLAQLQLVVWQGKAINSKYPCYAVVGMLAPNNISRQRHRSPIRTNPANPIFDYYSELDIFNVLKGDVVVEIWEEHALSANRLLGQAIIPLSWVMSPGTVDGQNMELSGWFELFPPTVVTRYNRYGQYRPYTRGIPITSGYGLARADKPIGLVKLEARLVLDCVSSQLPALPVAHALHCARKIEPYVIDLSSVIDILINDVHACCDELSMLYYIITNYYRTRTLVSQHC